MPKVFHDLPLCACCGRPLGQKAKIVLELAAPGRPTVGWHGDLAAGQTCARLDAECFDRLLDCALDGISSPLALRVIAERGPGRVKESKRAGAPAQV